MKKTLLNGLIMTLLFVSSCVPEEQCSNSDKESEILASSTKCSSDDDSPSVTSSEAVGYHSNGSLINGEDILSRSGNIHKLFLQRGRSFATRDMIDTIINIADEISSRYSNVEKLQVGDLSGENGGSAAPSHTSHQNGIDADIVYLTNSHDLQGQSNSYWTQYFVKSGAVSSDFNKERNWELFKYIVRVAKVNRILVDPVIKKAMCNYSSQVGERTTHSEVLRRLRPINEHHDHHFHLRLKCPEEDSRCISQSEPPSGSGC
jgi:penicillin-insensitive murein endopeptidase